MVPYALHGGDPLDLFRINEFSERIRDDYAKGGFFEGLIEKHMLSNPHYLEMRYTADDQLAAREEQNEVEHLQKLEDRLSEEEKNSIVSEAARLIKYQETEQDLNVLPSLTLNDISRDLETIQSHRAGRVEFFE